MGAQGSGHLNHDATPDLLDSCVEGAIQTIIDAPGAVEQSGDGCLDANVAVAALAAAKIVATAFGRPVAGLDPEMEAELLSQQRMVRQPVEIAARAAQAVQLIADGATLFEVREFWDDAGAEMERVGVVADIQEPLEARR